MTDAATSRRTVVVHGTPGHRLVEALRAVGLEPVATVGDVTTWVPSVGVTTSDIPDGSPPEPLAVSFDEAAQRLGVSRSSIYRLVEAGELHPVHLGRSVRIPISALEQLIERRTTRPDLAETS